MVGGGVVEIARQNRNKDCMSCIVPSPLVSEKPMRLWAADVVVVLNVVRQLVDLHRRESCFVDQFFSLFPSPHGTEAFAILRKRHGHAVHARDCVEESIERMLAILMDVA